MGKVKKKLLENFSMSDFGKAGLVLGIEIAQTGTGIVITQHKYVLSILEQFRCKMPNQCRHQEWDKN